MASRGRSPDGALPPTARLIGRKRAVPNAALLVDDLEELALAHQCGADGLRFGGITLLLLVLANRDDLVDGRVDVGAVGGGDVLVDLVAAGRRLAPLAAEPEEQGDENDDPDNSLMHGVSLLLVDMLSPAGEGYI